MADFRAFLENYRQLKLNYFRFVQKNIVMHYVTTEELYTLYVNGSKVCTDTRQITPHSLFFALKGAHFDGHCFVSQALEQGASWVVIDNPDFQSDERYLLVENVLTALQNLATHHRRQLNIPVIGLTGSNGKTTTKELMRAVLAQKFTVYATQGNLNNHIGVPLSILAIDADVEIAVIEMGANHQQEIAQLCAIAQPNYGLITNIGKAHLDGFGGLDGVKRGKGELYDYLQAHQGVAFVHYDSEHLRDMLGVYTLATVVSYGRQVTNDVCGMVFHEGARVGVEWFSDKFDVHPPVRALSNLTGEYNFANMLAAIAIGLYVGLSVAQINAGIVEYEPTNMRSQRVITAKNTIIADAYNANPSSMSVALDNMLHMPETHKVVILGDMFELGEYAETEHRKIIEIALSARFERAIFVGHQFHELRLQYPKGIFWENLAELKSYLTDFPVQQSLVLVKGSRGMKLESIFELL